MREAVRITANEKGVGPDSFPVELLNVDGPIILLVQYFRSIILAVRREGEVPQQ